MIASSLTALANERIVEIADALASRGFVVLPDAIPAAQIAMLRARAHALYQAGALAPAQVGREKTLQFAPQVRGDAIAWLQSNSDDVADQSLLAWFESVRISLNEKLFLALDHVEAHYAIYAAGKGYARHFDRHRDNDARVISLVLYLNDDWRTTWGGQLRIYDAQDNLLQEIAPRGGTLVLFRAEQFPHEVIPAAQMRISVAGWYRRRG